jgi:hypothetical protein
MLLLLVMVALVVGCSGEARKAENVVTMYNKVLIDAYLRPEPKLMELFVSKREYVRIESYIFYLLKNNKILKTDLEELIFEDVKIKDGIAEVYTKERWKYRYLDSRTRKPVSREYKILYSNVYYLKKEKGRWVVDRLDAKEIGGDTETKEQEQLKKMHERLFEEMKKRRQKK